MAVGTEVPQLVSSPSQWDDTADVLVVGFGIAGACAAISAAEAGAEVLILERTGAAGGASALAAGHFYLGGGTQVQEATGHADTVDAMRDYLTAVSPDPDSLKIDAYCTGSVAHFEWLEAQGLTFERSFYPGKAVVQPGTEGLMWTGNEKVSPYLDQAHPAPRGHKVNAPAERGGYEVMRVLAARVRELGIRVRYETKVDHLVAFEDRIVGVGWSGGAASGAVVLAAGGFVMNPDMLATYTARLAPHFVPLGVPTDDGLGIRLGQSAGGATAHPRQLQRCRGRRARPRARQASGLDHTVDPRTLGRVRYDPRHGHLRRVHSRRAQHHGRRCGAAGRRINHRGAVRRWSLRVEHRAGHRRLFEWNLPRGGLVLRAPRRGTRGAAAPGRRLICASPMPRR